MTRQCYPFGEIGLRQFIYELSLEEGSVQDKIIVDSMDEELRRHKAVMLDLTLALREAAELKRRRDAPGKSVL